MGGLDIRNPVGRGMYLTGIGLLCDGTGTGEVYMCVVRGRDDGKYNWCG